MFTLDWHQVRGLAFLAIVGLFALYFVLLGLWLNIKRARPSDQPSASGAAMSSESERRSAEAQPDLHVAVHAADQARRAA